MFNRRGVSAVVANVLIILLVVVGVALIWAAVRPSIEEGAEGIGSGCFTLNLEPLKCEYYPGTIYGSAGSAGYCWAYPSKRGHLDDLPNLPIGNCPNGPCNVNGTICSLLSNHGETICEDPVQYNPIINVFLSPLSIPTETDYGCFWVPQRDPNFNYNDSIVSITVRRNAGEGDLDGLKFLIKGEARRATSIPYNLIETKDFLFEKSISGLGELESTTLILDADDISEAIGGLENGLITNLELANIAIVADGNVCDVSTSPVACTCKNDGLFTTPYNQNANLCNYPDNVI